jgi:hypothetical protein
LFGTSSVSRTRTFTHDPLPVHELEDETGPEGRYYLTPGGRFPSVTTVIGRYMGQEALDAWRERVGQDVARKTGIQARTRGRAFHQICEDYVLNKSDWSTGAMPANLYYFSSIRPLLDANLGMVYGVEFPLWSSTLQTAGRTDLVAEWEGVASIIDFKTSLRPKTTDKIRHYLVQKACYSMMLEERTGVRAEQIVTLMAVDHEKPQVWVADREDLRPEVEKVFVANRTLG